MPTYEYACTACAGRLEVVQRISDPALTECPECGGTLRKVFSPVGVVFKGSGFYKTDSRGAKKPASSSPKPDAPAPAASSDSSAAPAPAAAPAPSSTASTSSDTAAAS